MKPCLKKITSKAGLSIELSEGLPSTGEALGLSVTLIALGAGVPSKVVGYRVVQGHLPPLRT